VIFIRYLTVTSPGLNPPAQDLDYLETASKHLVPGQFTSSRSSRLLPFFRCVAVLATVPALALRGDSASQSFPGNEQVRRAVERSLPYLEKVGVAWMRDHECSSCHNVTFLVWSHNEAAARGFDIDRKKLAEWTKWSLAETLSDRFWFKLRPRALDALRADGLPEPLLAKLKPLEGKTYTTRQEYLHALEEAVGKESLETNKDRLLKYAALPNNGGGPDTLSQLLLGQEPSINHADEKSYAAIHSLLLEWQEPDGSWQAQGQLPAMKWSGESEMHEATTMWSILALSRSNTLDRARIHSRERALESLKKAAPGITLQSLALHLIIAEKFGELARKDDLLKELLGRQQPDGGWAWVKDNSGSDAFSTGQALYSLAFSGHRANGPAVRRACDFLLRTQDKDGSWHTPQGFINTRRRGLNVYDYWGTAWATIGLLQTLPSPQDSR
jgi:Prenyltransferase and squalene oxidase repeat